MEQLLLFFKNALETDYERFRQTCGKPPKYLRIEEGLFHGSESLFYQVYGVSYFKEAMIVVAETGISNQFQYIFEL